MPTQVAIAFFYNTINNVYLENAIAFIDSDHFVRDTQEDITKFYVPHTHQGKTVIRAFDHATMGKGTVFLGLVHLGSTNEEAGFIGTRLVSHPDAQPADITLSQEMNKWAIDTAQDHVQLPPGTDSAKVRAEVHYRVDSMRGYFLNRVMGGMPLSPAAFYSV